MLMLSVILVCENKLYIPTCLCHYAWHLATAVTILFKFFFKCNRVAKIGNVTDLAGD